MTAIDELRAMLDERGVEWASAHEWEGKTFWPDVNGINATSTDWGHGLLVHTVLTPEQAIAATLGSCNCTNDCTNDCTNSERTETCHADETEHIDISWQDGRHLTIHVMECSECGRTYEHVNGGYEFCPRCGRKVVEVNE